VNNNLKKSDLTAAEREQIERAVRNAEKRAVYQKKRNARPEVQAKRLAYNRKRYARNKELLRKAAELGMIKVAKRGA
jgi:hypothetical protein